MAAGKLLTDISKFILEEAYMLYAGFACQTGRGRGGEGGGRGRKLNSLVFAPWLVQ